MCGRFAQTTPSADLVRLFQLVMGIEVAPRFNIAPTQNVMVIRGHTKGRQAHWCRWGLVPSWADDLRTGNAMFNARSETVFQKRSFAKPARHQRCIIPASGFYEWRDTPAGKVPVLFTPADESLFRLAGLWSSWADNQGNLTYTTTILTTSANDTMKPFHHRMPVILSGSEWETWIDPNLTEPNLLSPLLKPSPSETISFRPVSTRVNNVRNDDPACWEPYE
jgi:putative SOS response-associated peptidase YedK